MITAIAPRSAAAKAGIQVGETLVSVNGHLIRDVLDYRFHTYDPELTLILSGADGRTRTVHLYHREGGDLGLEFAAYLMDSRKPCQNRCIFCFIDQMPKNCRSSLYFKDDDARLSFLLGNYISLTALTDEDAARIIQMRISPLHISVHTTDPALRAVMLGNPKGGESLRYLKEFAAAGLRLHTQIVLCPGYNDGAALRRTLTDLAALCECVESTAVVPVGLTRHREGLAALTPVTPDIARETIALCGAFERVYASDELYLTAGLPLPAAEQYDDFPQLENGVGMLALFRDEWERADKPDAVQPQTLVTGKAAAPFLRVLLTAYPVTVVAVENEFFGHTVTAAGLLTGGDIRRALEGRTLGAQVLIPKTMLKYDTTLFLDDTTVDALSEALGVPVVPVNPSGAALSAALGTDDQKRSATCRL